MPKKRQPVNEIKVFDDTPIPQKSNKRPVVYVESTPLSDKQRRFLLVLVCDRFTTRGGWSRQAVADLVDREIDYSQISQDFFGEIAHLLSMDIEGIQNDELSNPYTGVERFFSSLDDFLKYLDKFKCLRTGGTHG